MVSSWSKDHGKYIWSERVFKPFQVMCSFPVDVCFHTDVVRLRFWIRRKTLRLHPQKPDAISRSLSELGCCSVTPGAAERHISASMWPRHAGRARRPAGISSLVSSSHSGRCCAVLAACICRAEDTRCAFHSGDSCSVIRMEVMCSGRTLENS